MEPITHFLTGACLGRAGFNRKTALATATMTLAAEAPDLDVFGNVKGPVFGFAHHRGFTHSFLGLILVSAAVVGFMYLIWRLRGRKTNSGQLPRWGMLFGLAYLAGLSHILLDFTNNYGVRPFWPFYEKWYSWDIVFIVEPIMLVLLAAAFILPGISALLDSEFAVRRKTPRGWLAARIALAGIILLWGVRDYEHRRAVNALAAQTYQNAEPVRVSAYPYWWSPFRWLGVVETENFFATMQVDSSGPDVDPAREMEVHFKPEETPATLAAKNSYLGRAYLSWAQYPITETEKLESPFQGYVVHFMDLRYDYPERGRATLSSSVELDSQFHVISETFGSKGKKTAPESAPD